VVTNAFVLSIGGVLQVGRDDKWQPAAFYSRQTRGPEARYSAMELEALAVVEKLGHSAYYLYRRDFVVFTDHKPLCHLLTSERLNARLRRLAIKLQQYMVSIEYLPDRDNSAPDALSRQEWDEENGETEPWGPSSGGGGTHSFMCFRLYSLCRESVRDYSMKTNSASVRLRVG